MPTTSGEVQAGPGAPRDTSQIGGGPGRHSWEGSMDRRRQLTWLKRVLVPTFLIALFIASATVAWASEPAAQATVNIEMRVTSGHPGLLWFELILSISPAQKQPVRSGVSEGSRVGTGKGRLVADRAHGGGSRCRGLRCCLFCCCARTHIQHP